MRDSVRSGARFKARCTRRSALSVSSPTVRSANIAQWAPGFQALAGSIGPSPAYVHAENFGGEVRVAGMTVRSGDLVHADRQGAVGHPLVVAAKEPGAAGLCDRRDTNVPVTPTYTA